MNQIVSSNANNRDRKGIKALENELRTIWLGRQDSNLRMPVPKTGALPLGDAPLAVCNTA